MRAIIIDDEPHIRKGLKILLDKSSYDIDVVAEAGSIGESLVVIEEKNPDLVFFDIQLSDGNSFEILNQLEKIRFQLIFITAYDQYAIKAFKYSAIDYLLKPIVPSELESAIERVYQNRVYDEVSNESQVSVLERNLQKIDKLVLRTAKKYFVVKIDDIIRCQSDQSYTLFYMSNQDPILVSKPLKEYEEILPDDIFVRVHKSHLINKNKVIGYFKEGFIEMENLEKVPLSSRRKDSVMAILFE